MAKKYIKFVIFVVTGLTIVGLIVFSFWLKEYRSNKAGMVKYVPRDTCLFVGFDLSDDRFGYYLQNSSLAKKKLEKFLLDHSLPPSIWRGGVDIKELGLAILSLPDGQAGEVWFIRGDGEMRQIEATSIDNYYYLSLDRQTAALSQDKKAIKLLRQARPILLDLKAEKRWSDSSIYGLAKNRCSIYKSGFALPFFAVEKNNFLEQEGFIYWDFSVEENNNVFFNFYLPIQKDWLAVGQSRLVEPLGQFISLDKSLMLKNFKIKDILFFLQKGVGGGEAVDQSELEAFLKKKYQISLDSLYTFFEQPALLVLSPKKYPIDLSDPLVLDNYNYGLVWQNEFGLSEGAVLNDFEKFIQNYLAFSFPEERIKILPDGSSGLELVANSNKFNWQNTQVDGVNLRFIKSINWQMAYGITKEKVVVANSFELAKNLLFSSYEISETDFYVLKMDPRILDNSYFELADKILVASSLTADRWLLSGKVILK